MGSKFKMFAGTIAVLVTVGGARGADWPQYLGLNRDGVSAETDWNTDWGSKDPARLWQAEVGLGCSSFAVAGDTAITFGNKDDKDTVFAFDKTSGKVLWTHSYSEPLDPKYYAGGSSASPTIDGGNVYIVSKSGKLFCLDLKSGAVKWSKDYVSDLDGEKPTWGWAAGPVVVGNRLIVEPGGKGGAVAALEKSTGELAWKAPGEDKPGYAIPVPYEAPDGTSAVAVFGEKALGGFRLSDGAPLFRVPWDTKYEVNASLPQHRDGKFFISSGYGTGAGVVDISNNPARFLWKKKKLPLQFQNSLLIGDRVVGVFGDAKNKAKLSWVEFDTGKVLWDERVGGNRGSVLLVGGKLLVLSETGELILGEADDSGFRELGRTQVIRKTCWAAPAFSDGLLLVRNNKGSVACWDLRK